MKKISVLTNNGFLFQKIKLALLGRAEVTLTDGSPCELRIVDIDSGFTPRDGDVTVSRRVPCDLPVPFPLKSLESLITDSGPQLTASDEDRCAILRGEPIKLTEVEYSLFRALMRRGGEFVAREDILAEVWDEDTDPGVINVYIHYLREKLERGGEKIIASSRKMGYKIDRKYLGGNDVCSE